MVQIKNLQNLKRINQSKLKYNTQKVLSFLKLKEKCLSLVFCDNLFIKKVNRKYFNKNSSTDVISFCLEDEFNPQILGEVIISLEEAISNSKKYSFSLEKELTLYIIHGILHLIGYLDHKKKDKEKMEAKQQEILSILYKGK